MTLTHERKDIPIVRLVPISELVRSKTNPRQTFDVTELARSIKSKGIVCPLTVRPAGPQGIFEIVAGERRFRAAQEAGLDDVPCRIMDLSDRDALEIQVVENVQRADVHPLEEAQGFQRLLDEAGWKPKSLASKIGKSESYVKERLGLLRLTEVVREAFLGKKISASHATELARLSESDQAYFLERCLTDRWTIKELRDVLHDEVYRNLSKVPWDLADAKLCADAGACGQCPQRVLAQRDLFEGTPEEETGKREHDACLNAECFENKWDAWFAGQDLELLRTSQRNRGWREAVDGESGELGLLYDGPHRGQEVLFVKIEGPPRKKSWVLESAGPITDLPRRETVGVIRKLFAKQSKSVMESMGLDGSPVDAWSINELLGFVYSSLLHASRAKKEELSAWREKP